MSALNEFHRDFSPITPPFLKNIYHTDYVSFSNFLSKTNLIIDQSGMITTDISKWSIETWFLCDDVLVCPQKMMENVVQRRDEETGIISTTVKTNYFTFLSEVFGARTNVDEAVITFTCQSSQTVKHLFLVLAIRPYTLDSIGDVHSIEYKNSHKIISINNFDAIALGISPKEVYVGNSQLGDINFKNKSNKVYCQNGMATIAFMYPVKKEGVTFYIRVNLTEDKPLKSVSINLESIKKDFCEYLSRMREKGIRINLPNTPITHWLAISKLKLLEVISKIIFEIKNANNTDSQLFQYTHIVLMALTRMGYFEEALAIMNSLLATVVSRKETKFCDVIVNSYLISAFSDYFILSRDTEYLSQNIEKIRIIAQEILNFMKKTEPFKKNIAQNSLAHNYLPQIHYYDLILITHAFSQYGYLCRTLGLFGEENTFKKEAETLCQQLTLHLNHLIAMHNDEQPYEPCALDEHAAYLLCCYYPFYLEKIPQNIIAQYAQLLEKFYKKYPIFIYSSGGWDVFLSMMVANNLLLLGNNTSIDVFNLFTNAAGTRYALPEIMNPHTFKGISKTGDSSSVAASIFLFIRNSLFHDKPERLELFPIPHDEWFRPKVEIEVRNAPSRFGKINFKVINTENEVQIYFLELPKFIPPDILIHLPFSTKLKPADDFVLKKDFGKSFIINGWPSVLQFLRK
ncbi:MAG: hypothetical protein N2316_03940 [Spirochaetes bacterium]|nr:hypothetical protein [Spirochaetota bacterium]